MKRFVSAFLVFLSISTAGLFAQVTAPTSTPTRPAATSTSVAPAKHKVKKAHHRHSSKRRHKKKSN